MRIALTEAEFTAKYPRMAVWSQVAGNPGLVWSEHTEFTPQAEALLAKVSPEHYDALYEEDGDEATNAQLAELTGLTPAEIDTILVAGRIAGGA